ncbi:MAG: hypothetical protein HZA70_02470 [Planctomycetes bacterium]|nr:hypothetical protein [Planctomycetota bacterium]
MRPKICTTDTVISLLLSEKKVREIIKTYKNERNLPSDSSPSLEVSYVFQPVILPQIGKELRHSIITIR